MAGAGGDQGSRGSKRVGWISVAAMCASAILGVVWGFRFERWRWLPPWSLMGTVALLLYVVDILVNLVRAALGSASRSRLRFVLAAGVSAAAAFVSVTEMVLDVSIEYPFPAATFHTFVIYAIYLCATAFYIHAGRALGATATWIMGTALLACFVQNWSSKHGDIYGFTQTWIR